jgi:ribonuclease J
MRRRFSPVEQARLGEECGIPHNVVQKSGDIIRLAPGKPGKIGEVHTGRLVLDGDIISPADGEAVVMRRRLSRDGVMFVVLDDKFAPRIETLGLPLDEDQDEFIAEASADVTKAISRLKGKDGRNAGPASARKCASCCPPKDRVFPDALDLDHRDLRFVLGDERIRASPVRRADA